VYFATAVLWRAIVKRSRRAIAGAEPSKTINRTRRVLTASEVAPIKAQNRLGGAVGCNTIADDKSSALRTIDCASQ
jgi:hypothetical protein